MSSEIEQEKEMQGNIWLSIWSNVNLLQLNLFRKRFRPLVRHL